MAASKGKKKTVSKDDLRRLMREKQNLSKGAAKRIDSPLAKYNNLDQLICTVCNSQVKSNLLWNAHIQGRTHKENVAALKARNDAKSTASVALPPGTLKRPNASDDSQISTKHARTQVNHTGNNGQKSRLPSDFFDDKAAGQKVSIGLGNYSSSESDDDDEQVAKVKDRAPAPPPVPASTTVKGLPSDFFDPDVVPSASKTATEEVKTPSMADKLPEGFFDDPRQDAKVRQVEFRDKMEDEWELFQKAMKEESTKSEAIQEEDDQAIINERNIDEIDDQLHRWSKVDTLAKTKEKIMSKEKEVAKSQEESDSDVDEQEFDEFLDWRTKKVWKT